MRKTAYVDFDGTVVNVFPRYHHILKSYLNQKTSIELDYNKYCFLKRQGMKDHNIVQTICRGYNLDIEEYVKYKRLNLESEENLRKDIIIGSPEIAYKKLNKLGYKIILLTQRNYQDRLVNQVGSLNISNCFDNIIVVTPLSNINTKLEFLKNQVNVDDIIIGDSKTEMECASVLGIEGFFVETGLWGKEFAGPKTNIVDNYNTAVQILADLTQNRS